MSLIQEFVLSLDVKQQYNKRCYESKKYIKNESRDIFYKLVAVKINRRVDVFSYTIIDDLFGLICK